MQYLLRRQLRPLLAAALVALGASSAAAQQAPAVPEESPVTLTAEERARYAGTYEMDTPDGAFEIVIYQEGERLMGLPQGEDEPSPLTPLGQHRFRPDLMPNAVITFVVDGDRAINFTLDFNDERGSAMAFRKP